MAKRRYGMDEARVARWISQGRGLGSGASYKPWLRVQDVPSKGRRHRPLGRKSGRVHHLMSDLELAAFLDADWDDAVVDVREQFPLDRDETRRIAADLGVPHPRDPISRADIVMTTDLVLDVLVGGDVLIRPQFVKPAADLDNERVLAKLEIERVYWNRSGSDLEVLTERQLPKARRETLMWLHEMHDGGARPYSGRAHWMRRGGEVIGLLRASPACWSIAEFIAACERSDRFESGEVLTLIRFLASAKAVSIDVNVRFDVRAPLAAIGLPQ